MTITPLPKQVIPEILSLCDEILTGKTAHDTPYLPPFMRLDTSNMGWMKRKIVTFALKKVAKEQIGNANPLEHRKDGYIASVNIMPTNNRIGEVC